MISLRQLLPDYPLELPDHLVAGLQLDSRQVAAGDAFVAVPGYQTDGRDYIDAAIEAGAQVVLAESESVGVSMRANAVLVELPQLKNQLSFIAARFYGEPARRLAVVGVTGTNGKTSVTYLVAQLLNNLGCKAGVIGTTGSGFPGHLLAESHTTPDAIAVQQRLAQLLAEGAQAVAMEVSSHALVQRRVEAIRFKVGVATNISRDHLDYHGTMSNYAGAKRRLFTELDTEISILNVDDAALTAWLPDRTDSWRISCQLQQHPQAVWASAIEFADHGTSIQLHVAEQTYAVQSPLLGGFNVYNLLAAMTAVHALGYDLADIVAVVPQLHAVPGRIETFSAGPKRPLVIVDYAHTPDALQQVLIALRRHCRGQLWCVFGCGGDRDRGKRPQMGAVAAKYADRVVITDDNPRGEPAAQIIADIVAGIMHREHVQLQHGREQAVIGAMQNAQPGDIVLLAGKGHEDYQIIGQQRLPYNERAIVAAWVEQQQTTEVQS